MSCIKFYIRYLSIGAGVVHKVSGRRRSQDFGPPMLGQFEYVNREDANLGLHKNHLVTVNMVVVYIIMLRKRQAIN